MVRVLFMMKSSSLIEEVRNQMIPRRLSGRRVFRFNAERSEHSRSDAVGGPKVARDVIKHRRLHHQSLTKNCAIWRTDGRFWLTGHFRRHGYVRPVLMRWA